MSEQAGQQLSFDVGGNPPDAAVLTISGRAFVHRELSKGEDVHLQVVDSDGQVVADAYGRVIGIAFKDVIDKDTGDVTRTERVHSVKVT